jgi:hypothetical protein
MALCQSFCVCLDVDGLNDKDSMADSTKVVSPWNWLLPAAVRDNIELPQVKSTPCITIVESICEDDAETKMSDVLTTITEEEGYYDSFSYPTMSSLYSIPTRVRNQLPPPSYFDMYNLPRPPSFSETCSGASYRCSGVYKVPNPPSLDWD